MLEQNKELFLEFVAFCESQPEDKEIDHNNWASCAVGQFAESKGLKVAPVYYDITNDSELVPFENFITELQGEPINDTYCLVHPLSKWLNKVSLPDTYGEFTKQLKTFL